MKRTQDPKAWFKEYAERSGTTVEKLREQGFDVFPCDCEYEGCVGWCVSTQEIRDRYASMRTPTANKE